MATSVQMPALGESVTEGTVTRWLKQEGDTVELDEPLLEVSTDKVDTEIPSPAAGVLTKIVAQEDDTVEVGGELAVIGDAGEDTGGGKAKDEEPASAEEEKPAEEPAAQPEPAAEEQEEAPEPEEKAQPEEKPAAKSSGGEATPVLMPELGESVTEGTVTRWLKKVGDTVAVDEPLVEVSTDKVDTEIPSPVAGTLVSITAEEDDTVAVGGELAKIGDAGATPAAEEPEPKPESKEEPKEEPQEEPKERRPRKRRRNKRSPNPSRSRSRRRRPSPSRSRNPNPSRSRSRRPPRSRRRTALRT